MDTAKNNKRIAKNTLILYFRMILTMLISLYTARVVLNVLGVEDYGTFQVVGGAVTMLGFLNGSVISATQRFLTFDIGKNDRVLDIEQTNDNGYIILLNNKSNSPNHTGSYFLLKIDPASFRPQIPRLHFLVFWNLHALG